MPEEKFEIKGIVPHTVKCKVTDEGYALTCVMDDDIEVAITEKRLIVTRRKPNARKFLISEPWGKTEAKLDRVWVEWFR